jgi:hypothetical protein
MSSIKISPNASGTGEFVIAAPNSNTNRTLTLPDATGTLNTSGAVNEVPAGSASAPSLYPTGDTNTGIFFPAADTIGFAEGGEEAMRIDSSGNVGIGVTSITASTALQVNAGGKNLGIAVGSSTTPIAGFNYYSGNSPNRFGIVSGIDGLLFQTGSVDISSGTERARINSDGDLLVNTTSNWSGANGKQVIKNSTANEFGLAVQCGDNDSQNGYGIGITNDSGSNQYYAMLFYYNGLTLDSSGNISITGSSTAFATSSDYRLKDNVAPMTGALATVTQLKPSTWTWKSTNSAGQGFIAHELAEVVPECVTGEKDAVNDDGKPIYQGVDTSFLVATLTAAIQELKAELDTTKARLAALEAK